jgi:hypothetical protein
LDNILNSSPGLEAIHPKTQPSPEPQLLTAPSSGSEKGSAPGKARKHPRKGPSRGEGVLIQYLGSGNYPELASTASEQPLDTAVSANGDSAHGGSARGDEDEDMADVMAMEPRDVPRRLAQVAADAHALAEGQSGRQSGRRILDELARIRPPKPAGRSPGRTGPPPPREQLHRATDPDRRADGRPAAPRARPARDPSPRSRSGEYRHGRADGDSIATSSTIGHFTISVAEGSRETLPAMQTSPRLASKPPMGQHSLPPLSSLMGDGSRPHQPPYGPVHARAAAGYPPALAAEPSSASTLSSTSPREPYRGMPDPTSMSPPAYDAARKFHGAALNPPGDGRPLSAGSQPSASSYRSGASHWSNGDRMPVDGDQRTLPSLTAHGPLIGGGFRCKHAGCTASPFQTQYLLKCVAPCAPARSPAPPAAR